jgi:hypothetical protein
VIVLLGISLLNHLAGLGCLVLMFFFYLSWYESFRLKYGSDDS